MTTFSEKYLKIALCSAVLIVFMAGLSFAGREDTDCLKVTLTGTGVPERVPG